MRHHVRSHHLSAASSKAEIKYELTDLVDQTAKEELTPLFLFWSLFCLC